MMFALAALTAAQVLIAAPLDAVGNSNREAIARLGEPRSTGTDFLSSPRVEGATDRVITLDFAKTRVRFYEASTETASQLLAVVTVDEKFPTRTGVHVGTDRGAVLRELGGPSYEDGDQIIYVEPRAEDPATADRVRLVIDDDRVAGIEWTFGVK